MTIAPPSVLVNDVHSRLNPTHVRAVHRPGSTQELADLVRRCADQGRGLTVAGGRHAMGGQAFRTGGLLVDTRGLDRVLSIDRERRRVRVQAGVNWRDLIEHLNRVAPDLAILQKPTGADDMTLGGSVAGNIHGRGLGLAPLVEQLVELELIDADGRVHRVSRDEDPRRFALVAGGYGQAGIVSQVTLQLVRRRRVRRRVVVREAAGAVAALEAARDAGALYGDLQMAVAPEQGQLLRRGVMATYEPVPDDTPLDARHHLDAQAWRQLLRLAHTDPTQAFARYAQHYRRTDGQVYHADTTQLATYLPDYHLELDRDLAAPCAGSEMITELYVPRPRFDAFLEDLRGELIGAGARTIYTTLRLIERDDTSALAWAREPWACLVLNLHVDHDPAGVQRAAARFRGLIDVALAHGGSFFLTYHRWATATQLRAAHPALEGFLAETRALDPERRFESDWSADLRARLAG